MILDTLTPYAYDSSIVDGLFTTRTTLAIGKGLIPEPIPDMGFLGWTSEQAQKFKSQVLRYWEAWAESPRNCDARAHDNFYELTRIASRSQDREGDVFSTLPRIQRPGGDCEVKVNLIEADCIDNPNDISAEEQKRAGIDVFGGVAESPHGQILGYWVCTDHPNAKRQRNRLPGFYKTHWYNEQTGYGVIDVGKTLQLAAASAGYVIPEQSAKTSLIGVIINAIKALFYMFVRKP